MSRRRLLMFSQKDLESLAYEKWENLSGINGTDILGDNGLLYLRGASGDSIYVSLKDTLSSSNYYTQEGYHVYIVYRNLAGNGEIRFYTTTYGYSYYANRMHSCIYGVVEFESSYDSSNGWYVRNGPLGVCLIKNSNCIFDPFYGYDRGRATLLNSDSIVAVYAIKELDLENYITSTYLGEG